MSNCRSEVAKTQRMARMFSALSHPLRLRLYLGALDETPPGSGRQYVQAPRPIRQNSFADHLGVAPSTLCHHLRILENAGLLHSMRQGRTIVRWLDDEAYGDLHHFHEDLREETVAKAARPG